MKSPHPLSEDIVRELAEILIPKHKNKKLARSAAEFLNAEGFDSNLTGRTPSFDVGTLRAFVDFLINKRGYN